MNNLDKFPIKIGDKLIANDEFHHRGFIDGEVIEIIPYEERRGLSNGPHLDDNKFGVTILGRFKGFDNISNPYEYTRRIYSCDFKINPTTQDVNIEWTCYDSYTKALFFTSQKIKDDFKEFIRNKNMEYHLRMAKSYGYQSETK